MLKVLTVDALRDMLLSFSGNMFATIDAEYDMDAKMLKRNNPLLNKGIRKLATTNVMVNFDYFKSMERRGDEASGTGNWSQAVVIDGKLTPLSVHKADVESFNPLRCKSGARTYLRCEFRSSESRYVDGEGNKVSADDVKPFLPAPKANQTVDFHLVSLNNVKTIRIGGEQYRIVA